jgi:hypothetical protein
MRYAAPCFDLFVRKEFIPVFERWLVFEALRIPILCPATSYCGKGALHRLRSLAAVLALIDPRHQNGMSLKTCR